MQIQFTAVFREVPEGYVAFVEELPGANTQGATLAEARRVLERAFRDNGADDDQAPNPNRQRPVSRIDGP